MTDIDTIETVAAGTVAMLDTVTKHIHGEDGYETTEERLFALLVNLTRRYAERTLSNSYPLGFEEHKRVAMERSIAVTLQALEENLFPVVIA